MNLEELVKIAITEDSPEGDVTVTSLFREKRTASANLIAKQNGIFYGSKIITTLFNIYDNQAYVKLKIKDGDSFKKGDYLCSMTSTIDTLLLLERTLLNFIQHLSGIATITDIFIKKLDNQHIKICDTRKTLPGLRCLAKEAVKAGGGTNHRFSLSDMILVKENHLKELEHQQKLNELSTLVFQQKKQKPSLKAEIEIETIEQIKHLDLSAFDYILLDNFSHEALQNAIQLCRTLYPAIEIEVSGNVSLETIHRYKNCDIDRISIGALTHSVKACDISLLIT